MNLSDIKGEQCFDVLARIMAPAMRIAKDEEAMKMFRKKTIPEGMSQEEYGMSIVEECFPLIIERHKDDLSEILAALKGQTVKAYLKDLNFTQLMSDMYALITDKSFIGFLS